MTSLSIPRRIIQTSKTSQLTPLGRAAVCNFKLLHPDWDYRFFDDASVSRFVKEEFPTYFHTFEAFPRAIQRIDFFRYLAVLKLGGFYFDLDVLLYRSLAPLTDCSCVFPFEELTISRHLRVQFGMDWELGNYAFGAAAGHPFLQAIVDACVESQRNPAVIKPMMDDIPSVFAREFQVLNSTGPGLISRVFAERSDLQNEVAVLFPADVCDEDNWHLFGEFGVHLMDGSWRDRGNLLWRKAAGFWEKRRRRSVLAQSKKAGPKRQSALGVVVKT